MLVNEIYNTLNSVWQLQILRVPFVLMHKPFDMALPLFPFFQQLLDLMPNLAQKLLNPAFWTHLARELFTCYALSVTSLATFSLVQTSCVPWNGRRYNNMIDQQDATLWQAFLGTVVHTFSITGPHSSVSTCTCKEHEHEQSYSRWKA